MYPVVGRKLCQLTLALFLGLTVQAAFSGSMSNSNLANRYSYVATISSGPVWTNGGKAQTFYLQPDLEKTYTANNDKSALGEGSFFLGMQHSLNPRFLGQLGLEVTSASDAQLSGSIWDDANPMEDNFSYTYTIQHTRLALKGRVLMDINDTLSPYLAAGLGVGFNQDRRFIITPKNPESIPAPAFLSHTQTSFTYILGAGMQKAITDHLQAGVGYEFADWGKNNLARAPGQTLGQGLALNHLYTQQLQFSLSYTV